MNEQDKITRILCEWDAKDQATIQKFFNQCLKKIPGLPLDGIYPMAKVDGESFS